MIGTHEPELDARLNGRLGQRHPRTVAAIRVAVAIWLLALTGIFCFFGYYWGLALLAPAALHVWLAARLLARARYQH